MKIDPSGPLQNYRVEKFLKLRRKSELQTVEVLRGVVKIRDNFGWKSCQVISGLSMLLSFGSFLLWVRAGHLNFLPLMFCGLANLVIFAIAMCSENTVPDHIEPEARFLSTCLKVGEKEGINFLLDSTDCIHAHTLSMITRGVNAVFVTEFYQATVCFIDLTSLEKMRQSVSEQETYYANLMASERANALHVKV